MAKGVSGPRLDGALADLRAILVSGLCHALARRSGANEATLQDFGEEALLKTLAAPDSFRGDRRFTSQATGSFVVCTSWPVDGRLLSGEVEEAEELFPDVMNHTSPLRLLTEEIDRASGHQLGGYTRAFSHIGLDEDCPPSRLGEIDTVPGHGPTGG